MLPTGDKDVVEPVCRSLCYCIPVPQSSASEDGRNYRPKHDEMILIINKIIIVATSWLFILYST